MAATPVDIYIHDTYFIVAHIHYVVFGGSIFGIFAGIYYWFPKMFGRMMNETLGKIHFWLHLHLLQLHVLPDAHPRRRRPHAPHLQPDAVRVPAAPAALERVHDLSARSAWARRRSSSSINFFWTPVRRREGGANPWHANTLEWAAPSPPPHGNCPTLPDGLPRALRVQRPRGGGRLPAAGAGAGARGGAAARSLTKGAGGEAGAPAGRADRGRDLRADRLRRSRDQHGRRPGGAGLADDLRSQHVPVPVVADGRRRVLRAQPSPARLPRRAADAGAGRRAVASRPAVCGRWASPRWSRSSPRASSVACGWSCSLTAWPWCTARWPRRSSR